MPNCTSTNTSTKARNPLLSFLSKNSQKSPYWKLLAAPIENSQGAYFQQKRERTTTRDSDKVKKLVSRDPVPETCFHRCNVPCRVKKCDFSNNLRIRSRNTGTKRVRRRDTIQFIPPSFRTYIPHQTKAGRGELTRPRYLI